MDRVRKSLLVFAVSVCGLLASAGAASADMLYAANGAGGNISTLYVLDANTGAVVRAVGPIGFAVTGLAIDPKSGTLYGSTGRQAADGQPNPGSLIKIDRSTGAGTLVGDERPNTETAADITFTPDGALYGWLEDVTDDLVSIDTATGAATVVGNSGLDTYGSGLASNSAGVLYFAGEGEQGRLFTIDRTSGAATPVATLNGPNGDPGISSLAFDSSGTLYGSRIPSDSPAFQSDLITIDTGTGAITSKGPSVDRLDGIAFVPPRSVTLKKKLKSHGTKVRLFGTVTDIGDPACIGGQTVQIQRKQLGGASKAAKKKKRTFRKFKKVTTKQDGSFSTKAKVTRTFKYRAFLPESSVCDDSTSKPKKVKA